MKNYHMVITINFYHIKKMCIICRGEYKGETELDCSGCTPLTSLPELPNATSLNCRDCVWLNHSSNSKYTINISRLTHLQRWYRRMLWCRYLASKEFTEWCYHPDNIGGKRAKKDILNILVGF